MEQSLSLDARVVAGTWLGMPSNLVFMMEKSRPTARAQAGLDELVERGLVTKRPYNSHGAVEYLRQTGLREHFAWLCAQKDNPDVMFELMEPIPASESSGQKPGRARKTRPSPQGE